GFRVRFKGILNRSERQRLVAAAILVDSSEPSSVGGIPGAGRPTYIASVEASSAEEALMTVREALEPDTANFSNWEVESASEG
ncbi:MAG TPA: hypothetical protein VGK43_01545, partial [Solirubrobacterales bacterium]